MKAGITVSDFIYEPGKNDAEYIALLEETLQHQKEITNKAIAKIKILSKQLGSYKEAKDD